MFTQLAALLLGATLEVTTYGAVANDATSDSAAFRAAFAAADVGDTVHAGCGTWDLPRVDNQSAVYLANMNGITFAGSGSCTSLKMAGGTHTGDYHVFHVYGGGTWTFRDFACNGNRSNIVSADEQTHCMNVNAVAGFVAYNLTLDHAYGDGIKFIGDATTMTDVVLHDITMDDNGRSGFAFAGCGRCLMERITATNISDSGIDTEPPSPGMIDDFTVRDTFIGSPTSYGAAAFSMSNGTNFKVYRTTIKGGVHCSGSNGILMDHVTINAVGAGGGITGLSLNSINNVTMNRVSIEVGGSFNGIHTGSVSDPAKPANWTLTDVKVTVESGRAFSLDGGGPGGIVLTRPHVRSVHPSRYPGLGLYARSTLTTPPVTGIVFTDVDITGVQYGITAVHGAGTANISITASGVVTLGNANGYGSYCSSNGGLTYDRSGLSVTATNEHFNCP